MPCRPYRHGDVAGISCGPALRQTPCEVPGCGRPHVRLCDFELTAPPLDGAAGKKPRTCDIRLCERHAWPVPGKGDTDLCPAHRCHTKRQRNQCAIDSVGLGARRGGQYAQ